MLSVRLRGFDELERRLRNIGAEADGPLREGFTAASVIVETDAKRDVHSPDHPYIGKAGYSVATGRLQASLGHRIEGHGLAIQARVGHPDGRPVVAGEAFGRLTKSGQRTKRGRPIGVHTGRRVNRGDVTIYGPIEERRHPFLVPALTRNVGRIVRVIADAFERVLR